MVVSGLFKKRPGDPAPLASPFAGYTGSMSPSEPTDLTGPMVGDYYAWMSGPNIPAGWYSNHGGEGGIILSSPTPGVPTQISSRNPSGGNMAYSDGHASFDRRDDIEQNLRDAGRNPDIGLGWYTLDGSTVRVRYAFIDEAP